MPAESTDPSPRLRRTIRAGVVALLLLAPLPFGAVQPYAVLVLELCCWWLGAGALALLLAEPQLWGGKLRRAAWLALPLVLLGLFQLLPLPAGWVALLSGRLFEVREQVGGLLGVRADWLPLSLAPARTLDATLRLSAYVCLGFAAAVAVRRPRHLRPLALALAGAGLFQALYGAFEYLSGRQQIFLYVKRYYLDSATGTFINRNHFASYLALTLPFLLALGWFERGARRVRGAPWLAAAGGAALFAAALLSFSRAGVLALGVGVATLLVRRALPRRAARMLGAAALLALALLVTLEIRAPGARFLGGAAERASTRDRISAWRAGGEMVLGAPLAGSGFGTFESAFPLFQPPELEERYVHVHNDWLQSWIEGGVVAFGLTLALLLVLVSGVPREHPDPRVIAAGAAALAGVCAVAVHSLVDFPLRVPAIAATAAVLCGLLAAPLLARPAGPR